MITHQTQLRRSYPFPRAVRTIEGEQESMGWVIPLDTRLYGVVKYIAHDDTIAWFESPTHFGSEMEQAAAWVNETLQKVKILDELSTCDECKQPVDAVYDLTPFHWSEGSQIFVCSNCYEKVAHELREDGAILDKEDNVPDCI